MQIKNVFMILTYGLCLLFTFAAAQGTTVEYQIAAGTDDTATTSSSNNVNTDLIYFPYSADPPSDRPGFFCWELDIPVGATIDSAYLKVNAYDTTSTAGTVRLQLLDYDDCPAFTSNPYSWSVTTGYVDWTLDAQWTQGSWYTSTDIKTLVQAFIDRANYVPGNYLGMKESRASGGYRRIRQWNYGDNTYGAKLEVTYSTNTPPTADAGDDQTVTDTDDNGSETVTLDGTGSTDSDGTIVSYVWTEGATQIATGANPDVSLSVGEHTIVLTVTDDDSDTDTDIVVITVEEPAQSTTVEYQIAAGTDDTATTSSANNVNTDLIFFPYTADSPSDRPGFFCWELDIPVGATIDSAYLKVNAYDNTTTAGAVRLQLLDYDDCPDFTTNPYSWSVTAGYVDWTLDASWTQGAWYTSTDIKTIVQEFIDRANYAPGNYLGMKESRASGGYRRIRQQNYGDNTYGAKLEVTYTTSGGPVNDPPVADADDDQTVTDSDDNGSEVVTLDGTGSSDSDGTIVSYVWTEGATQIATGANPNVTLSVGVHTITLTVTDDDSDTDTDTVTVTVYPYSAGGDYFVDFDGGSDAQAGTSPATAWKHCPGDSNATGVAASTNLSPGDTVVFKGGVKYRGQISCTYSGTSGSPITYDGNTAGTFGTGAAILDGSETLSGWTQCQSAAEAGGNPNWANIWYAYAPANTTANTANLYQLNTGDLTENLCLLAQDPNPGDLFFKDRVQDFYTVDLANMSRTTVSDSARLTQTDPNYWDGAYVMVWRVPNMMGTQPITGFDPATDTITFPEIYNDPQGDPNGHYAIYNHISFIDQVGEYYFNETPEVNGTHKVWLWPSEGNPNTNTVSISIAADRHSAFVLTSNLSYVTFDGLSMQKYSGDNANGGLYGGAGINCDAVSGLSHITVRDCYFFAMCHDFSHKNGYGALTLKGSHHLVEDNTFYELPVTNAMQVDVSDSIFQRNYIERPGRMGLWMNFADCIIQDNVMIDVNGTHSDGIAVFMGSDNVIIRRNTILNSGVPICTQRSSNIEVSYNLLHCPGHYAFAGYDGCTNQVIHNNTLIRNDDKPSLRNSSNSEAKNNIMYTYGGQGSLTPDADGNLIINQSMNSSVFTDAANFDFSLVTGSPALDAGLDLGYSLDINGTSVPQNGYPDIGADEYVP